MSNSRKVLGAVISIALLIVLFVGACKATDLGDKTDAKKEEVLEAEVSEKELSGELTIAYSSAYSGYEIIAQMFMELHPDVHITTHNYADDFDDTTDVASYMRAYSEDIASGTAGDIVDVSNADYVTLAKKGAIIDLNSFMENDEGFDRADYYKSAFLAHEVDGKVYAIPKSLEPVYIKLNKKIIEETGLSGLNDTVSYKSMLSMFKRAKEDNEDIVLSSYSLAYLINVYDVNFYLENDAYDDEYEAFQEDFDYVVNNTKDVTGAGSMTINRMNSNEFSRRFDVTPNQDLDELMNESDTVSAAYCYTNPEGEKCMDCFESMAVSKSSENKEAAWEFIKFAISAQDFVMGDEIMVPVNKAKAERIYSNLSDETKERLFSDMDSLAYSGRYLNLLEE